MAAGQLQGVVVMIVTFLKKISLLTIDGVCFGDPRNSCARVILSGISQEDLYHCENSSSLPAAPAVSPCSCSFHNRS